MVIGIVLDNPSHSYFAGQTVSGQIVLELTHKKKTTGIFLKCIGKGKVRWTQHNGLNHYNHYRNNKINLSTHRSKEDYFANSTFVLGQNEGPELTLPAGTHVYPFEFLLPTGIPSSFRGNHGFVQYYLEATVRKDWKFDESLKMLFTVNGVQDLNIYPGANTLLEMQEEAKVYGLYGLVKRGSVVFKFRVDRSGFVPGEVIPIVAEIKNLGKQKIPGASVKLIMNTIYKSNHKTKVSSHTIFEQKGPDVEPEQQVYWIDYDNFQIPPVPPTDLAGCGIINLKYELKVTLKVPGGSKILRTFPIVVGTIPFRRNFQELMPQTTNKICAAHSDEAEVNELPVQIQPSYNPFFEPSALGYPDLPPPSYEEVMHAGIESQEPEDNEDVQFLTYVPRYATYKRNHDRMDDLLAANIQ